MAHVNDKFHKHMDLIRSAMRGETDLRSNHKVYKKLYKHYKDMGAGFAGDSQYDYDLLLDCLYEDVTGGL